VKEKVLAVTRKRVAREPLSRQRIELAALDLIESEGLDDFSTRKLAAALDCEAMSIYHYFPSRQHLMDALIDRVLERVPPPAADTPPIVALRQSAIDFRKVALQRPNFQRYLAFHRLNTPGGIRFIGQILDTVARLGADVETTARLFRVIGYYLTGATLDETSGYAKGYSAAEPVSDELVVTNFPVVVAVNPFFKREHHEKTFLLGLEILLDGVRKTAAQSRRGRATQVRPRRAARRPQA